MTALLSQTGRIRKPQICSRAGFVAPKKVARTSAKGGPPLPTRPGSRLATCSRRASRTTRSRRKTQRRLQRDSRPDRQDPRPTQVGVAVRSVEEKAPGRGKSAQSLGSQPYGIPEGKSSAPRKSITSHLGRRTFYNLESTHLTFGSIMLPQLGSQRSDMWTLGFPSPRHQQANPVCTIPC